MKEKVFFLIYWVCLHYGRRNFFLRGSQGVITTVATNKQTNKQLDQSKNVTIKGLITNCPEIKIGQKMPKRQNFYIHKKKYHKINVKDQVISEE